MGVLTDSMTRLHGEIQMMRKMRGARMKVLEQETINRRAAIAEIQSDFAHAHAKMARGSKADRLAFVSNLKQVVAGLCREVRNDLSGAHRVWFGQAIVERVPTGGKRRGDEEVETKAHAKEQKEANASIVSGAKSKNLREQIPPTKFKKRRF